MNQYTASTIHFPTLFGSLYAEAKTIEEKTSLLRLYADYDKNKRHHVEVLVGEARKFVSYSLLALFGGCGTKQVLNELAESREQDKEIKQLEIHHEREMKDLENQKLSLDQQMKIEELVKEQKMEKSKFEEEKEKLLVQHNEKLEEVRLLNLKNETARLREEEKLKRHYEKKMKMIQREADEKVSKKNIEIVEMKQDFQKENANKQAEAEKSWWQKKWW